MNKKVVWLPYDFDTALGINNEGALVFSYNLEDIDHLTSGADVFNGQESVVWTNIREAFGDEIKTMYQTLRSQGKLSYSVVEDMFETHQDKWSEAIFNEDSYFKYLAPLVDPDEGENPTASYLAMLQGSKKEQRKWWLYNRFKYMDSKYNAGDALSDVIQVRGYAKSDILVTPYADVYASVKYGSYLVQSRAQRNVPVTLACPLDNVNDTEIYIYSASQLAAIGDLSGLQVGFADFSMGTKLQSLKVGDSSSSYSNSNLKELYLGNNALLQTLDVRNCVALGTDTQKTVDISGCTNIENVYFDGTAIQGLTLPNGGVLKVLRLPNTITNLTIMNQQAITDLTVAGYSNISTLRIENSSVDSKTILNSIPASARVRLIGFTWEAEDATEIEALLDTLDTMRGLDEAGNNVDTAQVSGTIHTDSLTGAQIASYNARYPYLDVVADHVTSYLTYKNYNGSTTIKTVTCLDGVPQESSPSVPVRANSSDGHYSYTGIGWNTEMDSQTNDASAITNVIADRTVYAAYTWTVRTYTVTWKNSDGTVLETDTNVAWGTTPTYNGSTPTSGGQSSTGWNPAISAITGDTIYTAVYVPVYTVTFKTAAEDGNQTLQTSSVLEGSTPTYTGNTPTTTQGDSTEFTFMGWTPLLAPVYANTTYYAVFQDNRAITIQYLTRNITTYESTTNTKFGSDGLAYATKLTTATSPVTTVEEYAFRDDTALETVDLSATSGTVTIAANAFNGCTKLTHLIIRSNTMATLSAVSAFTNTAISRTKGAVYVPTNLVSTYKADTKWSNYFITDINNYPLSNFDTITDSWSTIIANSNYDTDYNIGDTKTMDMGTFGSIQFELVAKNTDTKADNSGTARMTWVTKEVITTQKWNTTSTTSGGYDASAIKTYLINTVLPQFPSVVSNAIVPVTKVSSTYENGAVVKDGQMTTESIWLLSDHEVGFGTTYETTGVVYSDWYNSNTRRIKYNTSGIATVWWLRSAYGTSSARSVGDGGSGSGSGVAGARGVALGFCV